MHILCVYILYIYECTYISSSASHLFRSWEALRPRHLGCNVTLVVDEFASKLWEARQTPGVTGSHWKAVSYLKSIWVVKWPWKCWVETCEHVAHLFGRHLDARKPTMNRKPKMRRCLRRISDKILLSRSPRLEGGRLLEVESLSAYAVRSSCSMLVKRLAPQKLIEGPGIIETHDIFSMSNSVFTDFLNIT